MSSDSKTRSSRSKPSKRPERKGDLKPVDSTPPNNGRTNLPAMVLGMITTMVLVFGVFGLGSDKVVNEKYDAEQAKRKLEREEAARADTLEELAIKLSELSSVRSKDMGMAETLSVCRSRIDIARTILERGPKDERMRELAVSERLLAQVSLYGLDYTRKLGLENISAELESAYRDYLDDSNKKIYGHARVALLTHQSFEKLKSGDSSDVSDLVDLFADTINRFPDDDYVASMIEAHLFVLIEEEPKYAQTLFAQLLERKPYGTLQPVMEKKLRNISDRLLMRNESLTRKFIDRWANGMAGRRELAKTCVRLLNQPEIGQLMIRRCATTGQWFEQHEFFDEAKTVYDELIQASGRGNVIAEYRSMAKTLGEEGHVRLALQGQAIEYRGIDSSGKQLIDSEMKKKVGIVVYWSVKSEDSIRFLAQLNASIRTLANKPILIYAVCIDPELPKEIAMLSQMSPMIRVIEPEFEGGKNSLLDACPPSILPHVMLVAMGGIVHDVNAKADARDVKNDALALLLQRNRQ